MAEGDRRGYPPRLARLLDLLDLVSDRTERIQMLIGIADRFKRVPETIATRPYPESHRVPGCESQAFVWGVPRPDGTLQYHFAVENPQGISAMAMAVILDEALSGAPLDQVLRVPREVVYQVFGNELSMGKSMGLMGIVSMVQNYAKRRLAGATLPPPDPS